MTRELQSSFPGKICTVRKLSWISKLFSIDLTFPCNPLIAFFKTILKLQRQGSVVAQIVCEGCQVTIRRKTYDIYKLFCVHLSYMWIHLIKASFIGNNTSFDIVYDNLQSADTTSKLLSGLLLCKFLLLYSFKFENFLEFYLCIYLFIRYNTMKLHGYCSCGLALLTQC